MNEDDDEEEGNKQSQQNGRLTNKNSMNCMNHIKYEMNCSILCRNCYLSMQWFKKKTGIS